MENTVGTAMFTVNASTFYIIVSYAITFLCLFVQLGLSVLTACRTARALHRAYERS